MLDFPELSPLHTCSDVRKYRSICGNEVTTGTLVASEDLGGIGSPEDDGAVMDQRQRLAVLDWGP